MMCIVRVAALMALMASSFAEDVEGPVTIDSKGHAVGDHKLMRKEAKRHVDGVLLANGTAADTAAADTAAADTTTAAGSEKTTHLARTDISYNFVDEKVGGACVSHYEYKGLLSNAACAQKCYETFGCVRFSAGGCSNGCRITKANSNNPTSTDLPPDGQCITDTTGDAAACTLYQLDFFHIDTMAQYCSAHYEQVYPTAKNRAECAHACKNTAGCTRFSAEPDCMGGCRVSKCASNGGDEACPADSQCKTASDATIGCSSYTVFR